jgi:hypothetical protein
MANTDHLKYTLKKYETLPVWLKRSWNTYKHVSIRADFQEDLRSTRNAIAPGNVSQPMQVIRLIRDHRLSQGMDGVIKELLSNPDASEDDLLNLITPSLRFINYGFGKLLPSTDPEGEFERNERLRIALLEKRDVDIRLSKEVTYLVIPAGTTKEEIQDFVGRHYDEARSEFSADPDLYFDSDKTTSGRIKRVTESEFINERIYDLHASGLKASSIAPLVNKEFGKDLEAFEINKRLSQMKRRKGRH